jgi:hypothetical protein
MLFERRAQSPSLPMPGAEQHDWLTTRGYDSGMPLSFIYLSIEENKLRVVKSY